VRVLVTGADGFVGRWLVPMLVERGHEVTAALRPAGLGRVRWQRPASGVNEVGFELDDRESVRGASHGPYEAVLHLAAVASGREVLDDPGRAWAINAGGTARLCEALGRGVREGRHDPVVVVVSSAEVYAPSDRPLSEADRVAPSTPYGATKAGAELAAREAAGRWKLRVVVARPFPHTGPGQDERFVAPAFARRLRLAKRAGVGVVKVGNLEPVRDLLDVRDVARAYALLLERGDGGGTYNIASGRGVVMADLFARLAAIAGVDAVAEVDPELVRPADLPCLVGDSTRLREATGWQPEVSLDQTLRELVDAQAD
jgi:GDP-4-dehydro-6-deoxy-D-mannose reductase